ncbi:MAG: hypothetical protein ACMUHX_10120 [bacterium]
MNNNTSFSLSLQKSLENRKLNLDSEIDNVSRILWGYDLCFIGAI